jgi:integrase
VGLAVLIHPARSNKPYVFLARLAGIFNPWNRTRRRAGLPDVRLHDLRASFASVLVNQGVSLYVVQGPRGHAPLRRLPASLVEVRSGYDRRRRSSNVPFLG